LNSDKKALQDQCEKEANVAKQLLQEKHALQKAMGELLPREGILDEYRRNVRTANFCALTTGQADMVQGAKCARIGC
jgi:hypothetical protein